jgi:NDP-sugar pyrophosphorylase family protein
MNAIIVCGGLSTRLGDITKNTPKVLLQIGDRTVLEWQLEKIRSIGIDTVVLAAGHLSHVLEAEVGTEYKGVKIIYAIEKERLGTGGAIKYALGFVPNPTEPTFVLNGDILTTVPFANLARALNTASDGVILGTAVEDAATYGTLKFDDQNHLQSFVEKTGEHVPGIINGGIYLFTPHAATYFPPQDQFSIEYDVFPHMTNLFVYPSSEPWIDVGQPERLAWAREHWNIFQTNTV